MKTITASPLSISDLFLGKRYIIPPFQRPYAWSEAQCAKLWDDLVGFFESRKNGIVPDNEKYFLGTIVVYPDDSGTHRLPSGTDVPNDHLYCVIDGQQRLTTLALLVSAFASLQHGYALLNQILRVKNNRNGEPTEYLRICTEVLEDEPAELAEIILSRDPNNISRVRVRNKEGSRKNNFVFFRGKIQEWYHTNHNNSDMFNDLIDMVLNNVVLLPIHCESVDDAFLIFEVVNNRGKPLSESDIFKSNILQRLGHGNAGSLNEGQNRFLNVWRSWCDKGIELFLFRALMRITNAIEGNQDTTDIAIRKYFLDDPKHMDLMAAPNIPALVANLEKINAIIEWNRPAKINVFWSILDCFPNEAWKWPVFSSSMERWMTTRVSHSDKKPSTLSRNCSSIQPVISTQK